MQITEKAITDIKPYANNPRKNKKAIEFVANSIKEFGFKQPVVIDINNEIIAGHTRLEAAKKLKLKTVPCILANDLTDEQVKAYRLADNKTAEFAEWDEDVLKLELLELQEADFDMVRFGFEDDNSLASNSSAVKGNLAEQFIISPYSIFKAHSGEWQKRKNEWLDMGIKSYAGRKDDFYGMSKGVLAQAGMVGEKVNVSIFDPVLCEICYKWFMPIVGGLIFDPFAGGSVRGIVAKKLGYDYTGIDLAKSQIEANYENANELEVEGINWINDNSLNLKNHISEADLIFTCPPYFDLEVYSNDPADISNKTYDDFSKDYTQILADSADVLKENRFAIVVISNVRDKQGFYRDLTGLTKQTFKDRGLFLYNEIILATTTATAGLRAAKSMVNRKVVRVHQEVLIFYKGNPKNIQKSFAKIDFSACEELAETEEAKERLAEI